MTPFEDFDFEVLSPKSVEEEGEEARVLGNSDNGNEPANSNPTLLNGHHLPEALRQKVKKQFTGVGLKEIDPFYKNDNTFVVIGRGSRILYRFGNADTYFKSNGGWRTQAISILTHGVFNYFMVFAILLNCIIYAAIPVTSDQSPHHDFTKLAKVSNLAFLILYMMEFFLKILARGFYKSGNSFSCLAISWSWLDIFVILVGIGDSTFAFNGFRALKLIPLLPSWLSGYDRMFSKVWKRFRFVLFYACVMTSVLALLGTTLYAQTLSGRCVDVNDEEYGSGNSSEPEFTPYTLCTSSTGKNPCPMNYTCAQTGENPENGRISFDGFGTAAFTLTNVLFQDYAEAVYEKIWLTSGSDNVLYFTLVFFFGTFSIGTLIYAIIGYEFENGFRELCQLTTLEKTKKKKDVAEDDSAHPSGKFQKFKKFGTKFVTHDYFDLFITFCIILDMVCRGLDYYGIENSMVLNNFVQMVLWVYFIYVLEFILKMFLLGPSICFKTFWNQFDSVIAILIIIGPFLGINFGLTITCLKIVPRWPALNFISIVIYKALFQNTQWLFGVYATSLFVFAYFGYVTFGERYTASVERFDGNLPNWNTVNLWYSVRLMFRAFCGEWTEIMWDLLLISPRVWAITLMLSAGIVGNIITKMLGIGVVLTTSNELTILQAEESNRKQTSLERIFFPCAWLGKKIGLCATKESQHEKSHDLSMESLNPPLKNDDNVKENVINGLEDEVITTTQPKQEHVTKPAPNLLQKILNHLAYRIFTCTLIIILSLLGIQLDFVPDIIFVVYFGIETILRIIAFGFKLETFNVGLIFDVIMIINTILALSLDQPHGILHLGSFRILTVVSRSRHLQIVISQFWHQLRTLFHYLLATFFIWYVFALIGMTLYSGRFHQCVNQETGKLSPNVTVYTKHDCFEQNLTLQNSLENFDSVPNSLWSLVYVACRNGWLTHIKNAEDFHTYWLREERDANPKAILYFAAFLLFGTLFPFYIMMGVLFNDFKKESLLQISSKKMSDSDEKDEEKPKPSDVPPTSKNACLQKLDTYIRHPNFELWVCFTIIVDVIGIAIYSYVDNYNNVAFICNTLHIIILILYIVELILKAITYKKDFFKNWLNILLLLVVLWTIIDFILSEMNANTYSVSRMLRSLRLLHLLSISQICHCNFSGLKCFRTGLWNSISALTNIFTFYILIFFSYALFGSWSFNHVSEFIEWNSVSALFKIATISGIDGIYHNIAAGDCEMTTVEEENTVCGGAILGAVYITTFLALTILCFVNMYFVLILETVDQMRKTQEKVTKPSTPSDVATLSAAENGASK